MLHRPSAIGFIGSRLASLTIGAAVALVALVCADGAGAQTAPVPKRGGILEFAVDAEPGDYDCHSNVSFAFLHPVAPHYSTLLKFDGANYPPGEGRPRRILERLGGQAHL